MRSIRLLAYSVLLCSSGLAFASSPYGPTPAFYAGLQGGYAKLGYNSSYLIRNITGVKGVGRVNRTGVGAHAYIGYKFNPYFSSELGYTYLPDVEFKEVTGSGSITASPITLRENIVDWVARGFVPVGKGFGAFGKAGIAWATMKRITAKYNNGTEENSLISKNRIVPTVGAGLEYQFNPNVSADIGCTCYLKSGDFNNITFYSIGMAYTF